MDLTMSKEIIVPSFASIYLFWFIEKKDLLLRKAMHRTMKSKANKKPLTISQIEENTADMYCVNIEHLWARVLLQGTHTEDQNVKYNCWLPDYGIYQSVNNVFKLPPGLNQCPAIAKQASLYNVLNLETELMLGAQGYGLSYKKTFNNVEGVNKVVSDHLKSATKLYFNQKNVDNVNVYGDIICEFYEGVRQSLTDYLLTKKLVEVDEVMFSSLDSDRLLYKTLYMKKRLSCYNVLDKTEEDLSNILFNKIKETSRV